MKMMKRALTILLGELSEYYFKDNISLLKIAINETFNYNVHHFNKASSESEIISIESIINQLSIHFFCYSMS